MNPLKPTSEIEDDDLILLLYGEEAPEADEIRQRLAASPELQERYAALRRTLELTDEALAVPERPASYGAEVWARLAPRLSAGEETGHASGRILFWRRPGFAADPHGTRRSHLGLWTGMAAAALLLMAAGFWIGRTWPRSGAGEVVATAPLPEAARERILARTVALHLESSDRLFTEIANTQVSGSVDVGAERQWARDLLAANRLYRQSTERSDRPRLSSILDELEPFLIELSHGPAEIQAEDLNELRQRFEARSLLFKIRVAGARLNAPQAL